MFTNILRIQLLQFEQTSAVEHALKRHAYNNFYAVYTVETCHEIFSPPSPLTDIAIVVVCSKLLWTSPCRASLSVKVKSQNRQY